MTTIRVTEGRIRDGKPLECTACPVALEIQSRLRPGFVAYVSQNDVDLYDVRPVAPSENKSVSRLFPEWVQKKIDRFDSGGGMEPFEFELDIPVCMLRD